MRPLSSFRDLARRVTRDTPSGSNKLIQQGRREAMRGEGANSLFAWPALAVARRAKGKDRVNRALYERYHRPLKNLDERAGAALERELGTKKLFRQVDVLPTRRRIGGNRALIEHETTSATAPVSKAVKMVTPIAATMYAADHLYPESKMASQNTKTEKADDRGELLKQAADALDQAEKREEASKIAFALVERGKIPPFESYSDFEEKVASLMEKDLRVVEEALEQDAGLFPDFGKVASDSTAPDTPEAAFFHRLADD